MITVQFKLLPTPEQAELLRLTSMEFIKSVNDLVSYLDQQSATPKLSSASFEAKLPSAVKSEVVNTAKSVYRKYRRGKCKSMPILKKPIIQWNNQNYRVKENSIEFPLWINGKSQRIAVNAIITEYQAQRLTGKLGSLRITPKNGKWIAQVAVEAPIAETSGNRTMGVDLGLKIPAVAVTDEGHTQFFGNGRQNKYMKRQFRAKRQKLGKAKKQKVIKKLNNKEQRWMKDKDHQVSRDIVNYAKSNHVSVIRLEQLQNIRNTARTSRKNEKNLHTWSFYRLASFIEYKANLDGIAIEYVNPAYTSQTCPSCGKLNHAHGRKYKCPCGYLSHRDRVGAINIISAPVVVGNRQPA